MVFDALLCHVNTVSLLPLDSNPHQQTRSGAQKTVQTSQCHSSLPHLTHRQQQDTGEWHHVDLQHKQ